RIANQAEHDPRRAESDRHVPEPSRKSEQSRQNTVCVEREETKAAPPPGFYRSHESKICAKDKVPERLQSEVHRKKQCQGNGDTEENWQRRRTHASNKRPLRGKKKDKTKPHCQRHKND